MSSLGIPLIVLACVFGGGMLGMFTFGLLALRNATVVASLLVCALSVSGAILLILEMNSPFTGLMRVDSVPLVDALTNLGGSR